MVFRGFCLFTAVAISHKAAFSEDQYDRFETGEAKRDRVILMVFSEYT